MKRSLAYIIGKIILVPLFKLLFFYRVNGKKNVPKDGGCILCSNHLSNFDPVFLELCQGRQVYFMAKEELFKNPVTACICKMFGAFPVQRGAGDGKAINKAGEVVRQGKLLGIFIEGTRSKTGEFLRPKSGTAVIAAQAKVPVIPVCITPKNKKIKLFHKVTISIGEPIPPEKLGLSENSGAEDYRNAARSIMSEIHKLRERDLK